MEQVKLHTNYTQEKIEVDGSNPLYQFIEVYTINELHRLRIRDIAISEIFYLNDKKELLSTKDITTQFKGLIEGKRNISVIFKDITGELHEAYAIANEANGDFSLHTFVAVGKKCPLNLIGYRFTNLHNF